MKKIIPLAICAEFSDFAFGCFGRVAIHLPFPSPPIAATNSSGLRSLQAGSAPKAGTQTFTIPDLSAV
jgi:hypothetical protein